MPTPTIPHTRGAQLFAFLCRFAWCLEAGDAMRWWAALTASRHARCRWLVRRLEGYHGSLDRFPAWFLARLPPRRWIDVLDILADEGRLSRHDASRIQDQVLRLVVSPTEWR